MMLYMLRTMALIALMAMLLPACMHHHGAGYHMAAAEEALDSIMELEDQESHVEPLVKPAGRQLSGLMGEWMGAMRVLT